MFVLGGVAREHKEEVNMERFLGFLQRSKKVRLVVVSLGKSRRVGERAP